tara:strand:- start:95 stop:832 length:738 start_codon:yes stop_codon:yes gene_type:complete
MKQTLKTIIRNVKSIKGNSLAEFATTTALMATLAATAAPKLSEMSEGAKGEKSRNELDKLVKQAGQFYQDTADEEGRGRFPGQERFTISLGGNTATAYSNEDASTKAKISDAQGKSDAHSVAIHTDLGLKSTSEGWKQYNKAHTAHWISVFGVSNSDNPLPTGVLQVTDDPTTAADATDGTPGKGNGPSEWKALLGGEVLGSKFQDGHYIYSIVAGGGSGDAVYPPILYVADVENVVNFNNLLEP